MHRKEPCCVIVSLQDETLHPATRIPNPLLVQCAESFSLCSMCMAQIWQKSPPHDLSCH